MEEDPLEIRAIFSPMIEWILLSIQSRLARNSSSHRNRSKVFYDCVDIGILHPRLKPGIDPTLGKTQNILAARFYQLKVGHGAVGVFLKRIGVVETDDCWCVERLSNQLNISTPNVESGEEREER